MSGRAENTKSAAEALLVTVKVLKAGNKSNNAVLASYWNCLLALNLSLSSIESTNRVYNPVYTSPLNEKVDYKTNN